MLEFALAGESLKRSADSLHRQTRVAECLDDSCFDQPDEGN